MTTQIPRLLATIFEYFHHNFLKRILKDSPNMLGFNSEQHLYIGGFAHLVVSVCLSNIINEIV